MKEPKFLLEFPKEGFVLAAASQTILEAALDAGVSLYHVCGGNAKCTTCRVVVLTGSEHLSPRNAKETALQQEMGFANNVRLACQTYLTGGPVTLQRIIKDEHDISLYVGEEALYEAQESGTDGELVLFFTDIRNFTPFIEKHLPHDVIHIIRKLFFELQALITEHNGRVIETMGDGLYAAFGFDGDNAKACTDAVQCGHRILAAVEGLNETYFQPFFETDIQLGIGLHTGKVVSGTININGRQHTLVMGFAVNVAARLQSATKDLNNNFLISEAVCKKVDGYTDAVFQPIALKGVSGLFPVVAAGQPFHKS